MWADFSPFAVGSIGRQWQSAVVEPAAKDTACVEEAHEGQDTGHTCARELPDTCLGAPVDAAEEVGWTYPLVWTEHCRIREVEADPKAEHENRQLGEHFMRSRPSRESARSMTVKSNLPGNLRAVEEASDMLLSEADSPIVGVDIDLDGSGRWWTLGANVELDDRFLERMMKVRPGDTAYVCRSDLTFMFLSRTGWGNKARVGRTWPAQVERSSSEMKVAGFCRRRPQSHSAPRPSIGSRSADETFFWR